MLRLPIVSSAESGRHAIGGVPVHILKIYAQSASAARRFGRRRRLMRGALPVPRRLCGRGAAHIFVGLIAGGACIR